MDRPGKRRADDDWDDGPAKKGPSGAAKRTTPGPGRASADDDGSGGGDRGNPTGSRKKVQEVKHARFAMYHSGNEFHIQYLKDFLGLKHFECAKDSRGNNFTMFVTKKQTRVNHIIYKLKEFNRLYPARAVNLSGGLGLNPLIVTFSKESHYTEHEIIQNINAASEAGDTSYKIWNIDIQRHLDHEESGKERDTSFNVQKAVMQEDPSAFQYSGDQAVVSASAKSTSRATRLLETDMIPSSLNPVSSKRNLLSSTKPASLAGAKSARKKYVKTGNDQGHPSSTVSSQICVGEPTSSRSVQALADIGDVYTSDSEHEHEGIPDQLSVDSVSDDDDSMESEMPPGIQLSVDPLLQDENSMDSTDRSADPVHREFVESAVFGLDKSINATGDAILENRALMVEKLADLKKIITSRSGKGITFDYMVMKLRKNKAKNKKLQLALDQEEQKMALITRNYNKNVKDLRLENQALTSEISNLKKDANFSSILRSIDQKLVFQTSMQVYESSSDDESDVNLPQDQTVIQDDQGENGQAGLADGADGGLPCIDTAEQVVVDAFGNRNDEDGQCEEDRFWKSESAYEAFDEFKTRLLIHHLCANPGNSKRLDVSRPIISDDAFIRYLDIALYNAYTKAGNKISKSTAAHREYLQRLNGLMFSDDFNKLQEFLLGMVSYLREKLGLRGEPDLYVVFDPVEDVLQLEEDMKLLGFENGALSMDKLQKRVYRHWRERVLEVPSITQALIAGEYTELHFQMYYALIHKFRQTKNYVKSKEVDHVNYLNMVTGRFFDAATVVAMETPLVEEIVRLRDLVSARPYMQQKLQTREISMLNRVKHPRVGGSEFKRVCGKRKHADE